jgi:predicted DNA-binding transcriptional regulator AlpA
MAGLFILRKIRISFRFVRLYLESTKRNRRNENMNQDFDFGTSEVLSRREAAQYLGICRATLDQLDDLPKTRIRHRVMFKRDELNKWIDKHTDKSKRGKA